MMRARDGRRGQAMVEMALLLPVLMLLFLGSWTAANLIDDNNAAAQATRAGARLGAELGNGSALGLTQNQIDTDILDQVYPIVSPQLTNAKVTEIDIYQPSGCIGTTPFAPGTCPPNNGAYCTSSYTNSYTPVCSGVTELIDTNISGRIGDNTAGYPVISPDGATVSFGVVVNIVNLFPSFSSRHRPARQKAGWPGCRNSTPFS